MAWSSTTQCTNHTQSRIPNLSINHTLNHILILTQSQNTISLSTSLILSQSLSLCITSHTLSPLRCIIHPSQSLSLCITSHTLSHHQHIIHLSKSVSLCITSHTLSHHQHTTRLTQSLGPSHTIHRIHNQNHTTLHTNHTLNLRHTTHLRPSTRTIPTLSLATDTHPHRPLHMHHQLLHPRRQLHLLQILQ